MTIALRQFLSTSFLAVGVLFPPGVSHAVETNPLIAVHPAPPIAPRWSYEPWVWEDTVNTRASITKLVADYKHHGIPVGAVIIDSPWSTSYNDYIWNTNRYPDPAGMIREFHDQGIRVLIWMTGNFNTTGNVLDKGGVLSEKAAFFDEVKAKGYGVCKSDSTLKWWKGEGMHIDVTNPDAAEWFAAKLDPIMDMGVDGWKADCGVGCVPDKVETFAGVMSKGEYMGTYYGWMSDYTRRRNPRGIIQARPYSYQHDFNSPVEKCLMGWCGDFKGDFEGLQFQLDNLYRSANAGYGPLQVEVGGYQKVAPTKAQLIRYAQFGALMPGMENGGANGGLTHHLPWWHDQQNGGGSETINIYRYFATLHSELVPYIFSVGVESHLGHRPMVRQADTNAAQHLLGDDIFVSVMTNEHGKRVVFPSGRWIDFWSQDRVMAGGAVLDLDVPLNRYPIYLRAGSVIPMNVRNSLTSHGDAQSAGATTLLVFPNGKTSRTLYLPLGDGIEYTPVEVSVDEARGVVAVSGKRIHDWIVRVHAFARPRSVKGAQSWLYDDHAKCVVAKGSGEKLTITIEGLEGYSRK